MTHFTQFTYVSAFTYFTLLARILNDLIPPMLQQLIAQRAQWQPAVIHCA